MTTRHVFYQMLGGALFLGLTCTAMAQSDASASTKSKLDASDTTFMQNAAADNLAEVQMGQMAMDKSSNAQVKQLAQQIVDDHTKANDQLKTLAGSKQVTLPTAPTAATQKESKDLQAKNGSAFDQAWSKAMVTDHKKAAKAFTQESKQTKDPDVRQFAQASLPTLNTHLKAAQQLAAVPDARDQAMDQSMKSMTNSAPMGNAPPATATAATPPASIAPASSFKH